MPQTRPDPSGSSMSQAFSLTRAFDAPPEGVFRAWTEAAELERWWGPKGFVVQVRKLELKPGGIFHYRMSIPGGPEMWGRFVYREIAPAERLVFLSSFSDADESITRHPLSDTWPLEVLTTLSFTGQGDRTTLELQAVPVHATEAECATFAAGLEAMRLGFTGTFDQLDAHLRVQR